MKLSLVLISLMTLVCIASARNELSENPFLEVRTAASTSKIVGLKGDPAKRVFDDLPALHSHNLHGAHYVDVRAGHGIECSRFAAGQAEKYECRFVNLHGQRVVALEK